VAETLESLKARLARLLEVMTEARKSGNEALANLLADHAAKYLAKIADMQDPAASPPLNNSSKYSRTKANRRTRNSI
jgi:hypothetical protein